MREQLERRLQQLKDEYAQGEKTLEDLQGKTMNVQRVMLRLSGAIQVLEEELAATTTAPNGTDAPALVVVDADTPPQDRQENRLESSGHAR